MASLSSSLASSHEDRSTLHRSSTAAPLSQLLVTESGSERGEDAILRFLSDRDVESGRRGDVVTIASRTGKESPSMQITSRRLSFTALILFVGCGASAALIILGIGSAQNDQRNRFARVADEFASSFEEAWRDYEVYGLWIHEACRSKVAQVGEPTLTASNLGICSRQEFRDVYEYVVSNGAEFHTAELLPRVAANARSGLEYESKEYYATNYPNVTYNGITTRSTTNGEDRITERQTEQSEYWPVHYIEPVYGNEGAIDLDLFSIQRKTIEQATMSWQPIVSDRLVLLQEVVDDAYSIILYHPGVRISSEPNKTVPTELAVIVIRIPTLLARTARLVDKDSLTVYVFDSNDSAPPVFLGGLSMLNQEDGRNLTWLQETQFADLPQPHTIYHMERTIRVADRNWIVVIESVGGTFVPNILFVVIGGFIILSASIVLAFWFHAHMNRTSKINQMKSDSAAERATLVVETARKQASMERLLNEYIAHEVRNPLSAAITALSFASAAAKETHHDEQSIVALQQDIGIVDASLQFINELLQNMLDMHRASDRQMNVTLAPVGLLHDVLEPVRNILKSRGSVVEIEIDCPPDLALLSDRLRLKQIILNLAINSCKHTKQGFIRLRAETIHDNVRLLIEDSGPGIPLEKQSRLFAKFQQSLDQLQQGTGIGVSLSKQLAKLMGGDIYLDVSYVSGIENCPGTRFVVDLQEKPMMILVDKAEHPLANGLHDLEHCPSSKSVIATTVDAMVAPLVPKSISASSPTNELPDGLSALFVDDDVILRKLFVRSLRRVADSWDVLEATSGEAALLLCDTTTFDIIFIDQYMMSPNGDKQLLGTETVREMRLRGVKACICGLSANDVEGDFLENGANTFLKKPYPCEKNELRKTLIHVLNECHWSHA